MSDKPSQAESFRELDRELIEAVRAGDPTAYRGLVERYQGRVYAVIVGMIRDREEAKDLTQEVFIRAFKHLDRFRLDSSFYTWLYRIATNLAIDHIRKHKRYRHGEYDDAVGRESDHAISPTVRKDDPGKNLERKRLHGLIFDALDELSPDHRQIIVLREVEGLSYKEISEACGIPEGTVMSRLFYARRKMQKRLKGQLGS